MRRLLLPKLERLTFRLAGGMTLLIVISLTASLYLLSRLHHDQIVTSRRGAAELENRILEAALRHQMLLRDTQLMTGDSPGSWEATGGDPGHGD